MSSVLITGDSGTGKTALVGFAVRKLQQDLAAAGRPEKLRFFEWSTGGHSRYIEIPGTDGYSIPRVLYDCLMYTKEDPAHYGVLLEDEVLSSDPGFQSSVQKLHDQGRMGDLALTDDEFSRLRIIATGNSKRDGNKNAQAQSFYLGRSSKYRLICDPTDFLNSVVKTGVVPLHPLCISMLTSDTIHNWWLQDWGADKVNPRSFEAVSQRLYQITDPTTGRLPDPNPDWGLHKAWLQGFWPNNLVSELLTANEQLSLLTPLRDITADPDKAAVHENTLVQLMQIMLMESFLSGNPNNAACVPHFFRYCRRLSPLTAPSTANMVGRLIKSYSNGDNGARNTHNFPALDMLQDWDTTLLSMSLANSFRDIDNVDGDLSAEALAEITGDEEKEAARKLNKIALATDPLAKGSAADGTLVEYTASGSRSTQVEASDTSVFTSAEEAAETATDDDKTPAGAEALDDAEFGVDAPAVSQKHEQTPKQRQSGFDDADTDPGDFDWD
jgi:hypothetical protein